MPVFLKISDLRGLMRNSGKQSLPLFKKETHNILYYAQRISKKKVSGISQCHLSIQLIFIMVFIYYFIYLVQHLLKFGAQLRNAAAMFAVHLPLLTPKANSKFRKTSKVPISCCAKTLHPFLHSFVTTMLPGRLRQSRPTSIQGHTNRINW